MVSWCLHGTGCNVSSWIPERRLRHSTAQAVPADMAAGCQHSCMQTDLQACHNGCIMLLKLLPHDLSV